MKAYVVFFFIIPGVFSDKSNFKAFKFQQWSSTITAERFEIVDYNKQFFKELSVVTFKHNRTTTALNATLSFLVDPGNDMQLVIQFYRFASNEYRQFPLRFQINACDTLKEDAFGVANVIECGNFRGCPVKKDVTYFICNWVTNGMRFPPLIPNGRYKVEVHSSSAGTYMGIFNAYISINPPPPKIVK